MIKAFYASLLSVLLVIALMIGFLFITPDSKASDPQTAKIPEHHLQIVVQSSQTYFQSLFIEGAMAAASDLHVYTEFIPIQDLTSQNLVKTVEMGIMAGVDGIGLQAADHTESRKVINDAIEAGIPVVTFENDRHPISDIPSVGSNSYDIGYVAGEMAVEASGASANVAVILGSREGLAEAQSKNMIVQGIIDAFSRYSGMNITLIYTLDTGLFEAEQITYQLLGSGNNINLIICTDEGSTPGVAQVLVDDNKVGDVQVIGYGAMPLTLDYIARGVIYGAVCPDAFGIGYNTVAQLVSGLNDIPISDYITTDLYTIDSNNVASYIDKN